MAMAYLSSTQNISVGTVFFFRPQMTPTLHSFEAGR